METKPLPLAESGEPSSKTQSMGVYAIGMPGIAIITKSTQNEDASGGDTNVPTQANLVTTTMSTEKRGPPYVGGFTSLHGKT